MRLCHAAQTCCDNNTIFPDQKHDISHRAQCDQVGVLFEYGALLAVSRQCARQLERHTDACQLGKRVGAVGTLGIDDRVGVGQFFPAFVVIGHDHFHAEFACASDLLERRNARVHRDDQSDAVLRQTIHRAHAQTVTLAQAVGNIMAHIRTQTAQYARHHTGGSHAVHVVVAEYCNLLSLFDRSADGVPRFGHIRQQHWIMQLCGIGFQKGAGSLRGVNPARA